MRRYTETKDSKNKDGERGLKAPTRDIAIVNKDGRRSVVSRDMLLVVPYFRDTNEVMMQVASFSEWVKEDGSDTQALVFPHALFWDAAFTHDSIKVALGESGIILKKFNGLYEGPVMQRGIEQSGRVKFYLLDLGWWDYRETTHLESPFEIMRVGVPDLAHIDFNDAVTQLAALWAKNLIGEHDLAGMNIA